MKILGILNLVWICGYNFLKQIDPYIFSSGSVMIFQIGPLLN